MQYQPVCTFTMYFSRFVLQVQQRIGYCPQVGMYVTGKGKGVEENTWKREREKDKGEGVTNKIIFCFMSIADNNYNLIPRLSCHSTGAGARYPA